MGVDNKKNKSNKRKIVVNSKMPDHSKNPFFIQKAEESKKVIEKYGLPKKLITNSK